MAYFELTAGCYEEFLLGYKFQDSALVQSFASHDHSSSIRAVAACEQFLASGATDDRIIIYDLKTRREHCMLTHHNSTVTCLQFTIKDTHLISGSVDGTLTIVKTGSWAVEKIWDKAHKGLAIYDIAIHPSGKLALTLGADKTLRTWNLIKGRQAYAINLNSKSKDATSLEKILWGEDGIRFILYGGKYTEIWSIEAGGILQTIDHNSKVSSCLWLSKDEILVGYESGDVSLIDINSDARNNHKAHESRVKALAKCKEFIITASSSGEIKVWNSDFDNLASVNSGCRITCLTIINSIPIKKEEKIDESDEEIIETVEKKQKTHVVVEVEDDSTSKKISKKKRKNRDTIDIEKEMSVNSESVIKKKKRKKQKLEENSILPTIDSEIVNKKHKKKKQKLEENSVLPTIDSEIVNKKRKKKNKNIGLSVLR